MKELETNIYTPASSLRQPQKLAKEMCRDLWRGRGLAWRLAVRDISAQYRQAALGLLWAVILPLANTLIWVFLNNTGIVAVEATKLPYPVYVFTGTVLWAVFMDAVNAPLQTTNSGKAMLAKVNFPREALIVSGVYQVLFNTSIKVVLLILVLLWFEIYPGLSLLLFPFTIISLIAIGTVVGLLLTPLGMLYTDVGKSLPVVMQFAMYLTPVVFPMPKGGWAAAVFEFNPMTPLILTARDWLTGSPAYYVVDFLLVNIALAFLLIVVWVLYRLAMPILIERMSA